MQILYHISKTENKQFIITTHSPSILSSVPDKARIFIERDYQGSFKIVKNISVNAALSKMDSISYPLVDVFCEDHEAERIINKAIAEIQKNYNLKNFNNLINVIITGDAEKTYRCFKSHQETYPFKRIKTGYGCVLDGDQRNQKTKNSLSYPPEECLHFLYSESCPEKFLVQAYLQKYPNTHLKYHYSNSNPHSLFEKMIELSIGPSKSEIFEICWKEFMDTQIGQNYFNELQTFLVDLAKKFSPDL